MRDRLEHYPCGLAAGQKLQIVEPLVVTFADGSRQRFREGAVLRVHPGTLARPNSVVLSDARREVYLFADSALLPHVRTRSRGLRSARTIGIAVLFGFAFELVAPELVRLFRGHSPSATDWSGFLAMAFLVGLAAWQPFRLLRAIRRARRRLRPRRALAQGEADRSGSCGSSR